MNESEAVNSSVKPKALSLRRYDFTSLGKVIEVPGGSWVKWDDVMEMLTNAPNRTEESFLNEKWDKIPVDPQKPLLDDSAKDYRELLELAKANKGIRRLRKKLDAAKKRIIEMETTREHPKRTEEDSGNVAEKGFSHSESKAIPEGAILIWGGDWIITSNGNLLPR